MSQKLLILSFLIFSYSISAKAVDQKETKKSTLKTENQTNFKKIKKSAEQGNASAQNNIGVMYALGEGPVKNYKKAFYWFKKAAKQGYVPAQFHLGLIYHVGKGAPKNYKKALYWYKKAEAQSYAPAQFRIGLMYDLGHAVPEDHKQALQWYKKAAEQGYALAQFHLGMLYYWGILLDVPHDYKKAFYWSKKSAEQGYVPAQAQTGLIYYIGVDDDPNFIQAYLWLNLAVLNGDKKTIELRDLALKKLSQDQIAAGKKLSIQKAKEIAQKNPNPQMSLDEYFSLQKK